MYIYNITFVTEPSRLEKLFDWIRTHALPRLEGDGACSPRLATIEKTAGSESNAESVALQFEFSSLEDFERWEAARFVETMKDYSVAFAPEPLIFATLLRCLPLK